MAAVAKEDTKEEKADIPIVVMGLMFLALSLVEYFVPPGSEGDRAAVKLLCAAQIAFGLGIAFIDRRPRPALFRNPVHNAALLLLVWLTGAGLLGASDLQVMLGGCAMYFYWYAMFVFFYTRSVNSSSKHDVFLMILAASLVVWVLALRRSVSVQMDIAGRDEQEQIQNYIGYYMVTLLPFVLLLRWKSIKVIALGLISYGAFYSLKRGVILALVLASVGSTIVYLFYVCTAQERRRGIAAVLVVWFLGMGAAATFYTVNKEAVTRRLVPDTSREQIYSATLAKIQKSDFFDAIVGHGFMKSLEKVGFRSHNDWLFLQYDYGVVGVLLMLNVYLALFALLWRLCKSGSPLAVSLACGIILMFCVQMYSIGLYQKIFGFVFGGLGLVAGTSAVKQETPTTAARA